MAYVSAIKNISMLMLLFKNLMNLNNNSDKGQDPENN